MYVCMYVCMHACMHAYLYVWTYVCLLSNFNVFVGISIQNAKFQVSPTLLMAGDTVRFNASWLMGTDVIYTVNITSNTSSVFSPIVYKWNALDYSTNYGPQSALYSDSFEACGAYVAYLRIYNDISSAEYWSMLTVSPVLNISIALSSVHVSGPTPSVASFLVSPIVVGQCLVSVMCHFDFGDGFVLDKFLDVQDAAVYINHTYTIDMSDATAKTYCNNNFSFISDSAFFKFQLEIVDLNITALSSIYSSNVLSYCNISMTSGSHVSFFIQFGDGTSNNYTHPNRLSYQSPFQISHTYVTPGSYIVEVIAFNKYYSANTSLSPPIIIQNPIIDYTMKIPSVLTIPPGSYSLTVIPNTNIAPASNVTCTWSLGSKSVSSFCLAEDCNDIKYLPMSFNDSDVALQVNSSVNCYNLVSSQSISSLVDLYVLITELSVIIYRDNLVVIDDIIYSDTIKKSKLLEFAILLGDTITVTLNAGSGSSVRHNVTFVDDNHYNLSDVLSAGDVFTVSYLYQAIGNYTLKVVAMNSVSHIQYNVTVIVQNKIENLVLQCNSSVIWPPGKLPFQIKSPALVSSPLTDVFCVWELSNGYSKSMFTSQLDIAHSIIFPYVFSYSDVGEAAVAVNCSNILSSQVMNASVVVIADVVILSSFYSNKTMVRNTTRFSLSVKRFATVSCFLIDYGDDSSVAFANDIVLCQEQRLATYTLITTNSSDIIFYHTYQTPGVYTSTVLAFSAINNDTMTSLVLIYPLPCTNPIIRLPQNFSSSYTSYRATSFSIEPNITTNCSKVWPFFTQWQVLASDGLIALTQNQLNFNYSSNTLNYGTYNISITVAMYSESGINMDGISSYAWFALNIIKSPLKAKIFGGELVSVRFNNIYILNAVNQSIDPDAIDNDKTGFTFRWFCKQEQEPLDCTVTTNTLTRSSVNDIYDPLSGKGGCFGKGPAQLVEDNGLVTLQTGNMLPRLNYTVCLQLFKDVRTAVYEQHISLILADPPIISIRYSLVFFCISYYTFSDLLFLVFKNLK